MPLYDEDYHGTKFLINLEETNLKVQAAISKMIYEVELWEDVSIAYTDTSSGDLRIRKHLPNNHFVNAVTLNGRKIKNAFFVKQCYLKAISQKNFLK